MEVGLVADEHDHDVVVAVFPQLLEPLLDTVERRQRRDIVNEHGADSALVIRRCHGSVPLLASGVPYLCFNGLFADLDGLRCELDADRCLRIRVELIPHKL